MHNSRFLTLIIIFFLLLNLAVWLAVIGIKRPQQPVALTVRYREVRDTVEVIDTVVLTKLKLRIDTIKETKLLTQNDSLLLSLTNLSE